MDVTVEFKLNGEERRVTSDPRRTLLEVLREDLGLTGAKYGCGEGQCRACTVLQDGEPVMSCLMPVSSMNGRSVETIEGLAQNDELDPVQEAFVQENAMQCGYCTPGMILTAVALLRRSNAPTRDQIIEALNGNLCRCCGYVSILSAIERAAKSRQEAK